MFFRWFQRITISVVLLTVLLCFGAFFWVADAAGHGPYTIWYNERFEHLSLRAGLVGRPERDVVKILGHPSSVWKYENLPGESLTSTYNYAPCPMVATGMFQVHCRDGVVRRIEKYDD